MIELYVSSIMIQHSIKYRMQVNGKKVPYDLGHYLSPEAIKQLIIVSLDPLEHKTMLLGKTMMGMISNESASGASLGSGGLETAPGLKQARIIEKNTFPGLFWSLFGIFRGGNFF